MCLEYWIILVMIFSTTTNNHDSTFLTVFLQSFFSPSCLFDVSPSCFSPPPKVYLVYWMNNDRLCLLYYIYLLYHILKSNLIIKRKKFIVNFYWISFQPRINHYNNVYNDGILNWFFLHHLLLLIWYEWLYYYNWIEEESLSSLIKWVLFFILINSYESIICLLLTNTPKWLIIRQMQSSHYLLFYEQHIRTSYQHFVPLSFLLQLNDKQHQSQDHLSIHQSYSINHTNCSSVNNSNPGCSCNWFLCHSDNSSTSVIVYKIPPGRK